MIKFFRFSQVLTIACLFGPGALLWAQKPQKLKLWYDKPAQYFEEALVLGNGTQGATVFGGTESDKIFLNDITLWSGEPMNPRMNPEAYKNLPAVREALKAELGDVLWYLAQTCTELEISLDEVAEANITKLMDRQARGKIQGDGDNR